MKQLWNFILLMGILCLAGCKEEEPYVDITIDKQEIGKDGGPIGVSVSANGRWSVKLKRGDLFLDAWQGEGDGIFTILVGPNTSFDEYIYTLTTTSEGGTGTTTTTFTQKASIGLEADTSQMIPAEGGTFSLPVNTNDDISSVDAPEWMTFTSSRALTGYTYSFVAGPNKTGSIRNGTISFNGKSDTWKVEVTQDSYAPTSIGMEIPDSIDIYKTPCSVPVSIEPEYADLFKISATVSDGTGELKDGMLFLSFNTEGTHAVSIRSEGKELYSKEVVVYDGKNPSFIDIEMSNVLCTGKRSYFIKAYPAGADLSNLKIKSYPKGAFTIEGDSLCTNITRKGITHSLEISSEGKVLLDKEFDVIDHTSRFNVQNFSIHVLNEVLHIRPEIPISLCKIVISDESVLKKTGEGTYMFVGEGKTDIELTNVISKEKSTVEVECRKLYTYAELYSCWTSYEFDVTLTVYLKGVRVGPGKLHLYKSLKGSSRQTVEINTEQDFDLKKFNIHESVPILGNWDDEKRTPQKYRIVYEGKLNGIHDKYDTGWIEYKLFP